MNTLDNFKNLNAIGWDIDKLVSSFAGMQRESVSDILSVLSMELRDYISSTNNSDRPYLEENEDRIRFFSTFLSNAMNVIKYGTTQIKVTGDHQRLLPHLERLLSITKA